MDVIKVTIDSVDKKVKVLADDDIPIGRGMTHPIHISPELLDYELYPACRNIIGDKPAKIKRHICFDYNKDATRKSISRKRYHLKRDEQVKDMKYVCFDCNKIYEENQIERIIYENGVMAPYNFKCTTCGSTGNNAIIDSNISEIILDLNNKGYITNFCCGGHTYEGYDMDIYLYFDNNVMNSITLNSSIPEGWRLDNYEGSTTIRAIRNFEDYDDDLQKFIDDKVRLLKEWSDSLPAIK